jgi:alpha-tubulin suppressor-like RCC1 family protein
LFGVAALAASASVTACHDQSALAPRVIPKTPLAMATAIPCEAQLSTKSVTCGAPTVPVTASSRAAAARSALARLAARGATSALQMNATIGGQGQRVDVTLGFEGYYTTGAGAVPLVNFFVEMRNLLGQPMATYDGVTPDTLGVRMFFEQGPTVIGGSQSGADTVQVTGAAVKTGSFGAYGVVPYVSLFKNRTYDPLYGAPFILAPGDAANGVFSIHWPNSVSKVAFRLLVEATVANPTDDGLAPTALLWEDIALGDSHACGLRPGGTVYCWGDNSAGQLGFGGVPSGPNFATVDFGLNAAAIGIGEQSTCIVQAGALNILCRGVNTDEQISPGNFGGVVTYSVTPLFPSPASGYQWRNVAMGARHACAVSTTGEVWCWGANDRLQLGAFDVGPTPVQVVTGFAADTVVAGKDFSCAAQYGVAAACWGDNSHGQLGSGSNKSSDGPQSIALIATKIKQITAGDEFACSRRGTGTGTLVDCWGRGTEGQLGNNDKSDLSTPAAVFGTYSAVSAGSSHACAIVAPPPESSTPGGPMACWGLNDFGQLAVEGEGSNPAPSQGAALGPYVRVAAGRSASCGATTTGDVECWGSSRFGVLSNPSGSRGRNETPASLATVPSPDSVSMLVMRGDNSCFAPSFFGGATSVFCRGRVGLGDLLPAQAVRQTPLGVSGVRPFTKISVGRYHTCAIAAADSTAWCWGEGLDYALGNLDEYDRPVPTPVYGNFQFTEIAAGDRFTCGMVVTRGLYCWGANTHGQLGTGSTYRAEPSPIAIIAEYNFDRLVAGADNICGLVGPGPNALTFRGSAYCWGRNDEGQLGTGDNFDVLSPPINGIYDITAIALGEGHTCVGKPQRDFNQSPVRCTGRNDQGQLGDGTYISRVSFADVSTSIPRGAEVGGISAGRAHSCVARLNNYPGVFCWGDGSRYQDGSGISSATPRAVTFSSPYFQALRLRSTPHGDMNCLQDLITLTASCWGGDNRWLQHTNAPRGQYLLSSPMGTP